MSVFGVMEGKEQESFKVNITREDEVILRNSERRQRVFISKGCASWTNYSNRTPRWVAYDQQKAGSLTSRCQHG